MTISFYGEPYDIREAEAYALTNKVAWCLSDAGYLEENAMNAENFMERCNLNFETEDAYDWKQQGQYYVEIDFYNFSKPTEKISTIKQGNEALETNCEKKGKGFPVCLKRSFYVLDREKNQYQIDILSIVRKTDKNAQ